MKKVNIFIVLLGIFTFIPMAYAKGNATVEFESNSVVEVGNIFTVNMVVDNVDSTYDGIVSLGGNLLFDENVIKYVSNEQIQTPYEFYINPSANYKLAGLDLTLNNGIKSRTVVYALKFEALNKGTTAISFINGKLTDSKDYVNTTVNSIEIEVVDKEIKPTIIKKNETKKEVKEESINTIDSEVNQLSIKIKRIYNLFKNLFK